MSRIRKPSGWCVGQLAGLALAIMGAACGSPEPHAAPRVGQPGAAAVGSPAFDHAADSPEVLVRDVLKAIARNDRARLEELALTEREFRTVVWPRLPSSRPEVGLPVDYAWKDLSSKSLGHLITTLHRVGGQRLMFVDLQFRGDTTNYGEFTVYRKSEVDVRDAAGELRRVRLFGSMIERGGRVKVFSYVVD